MVISVISGSIWPVFVNMDENEVVNKQMVMIEIYGNFQTVCETPGYFHTHVGSEIYNE